MSPRVVRLGAKAVATQLKPLRIFSIFVKTALKSHRMGLGGPGGPGIFSTLCYQRFSFYYPIPQRGYPTPAYDSRT